MSLEQNIKTSILSNGELLATSENTPKRYAGRQQRYFEDPSSLFVQKYAKYGSDFVRGRAQGLYEGKPHDWTDIEMRMADIITPSAATTHRMDGVKQILISNPAISYVPKGTKIEAMGSTWLSVNPMNISGSDGQGVVKKCNATWNYLDWYGNICKEPLVIENERARANDEDAQKTTSLTKGYFDVTCQRNEATRQIDNNTRMIFGSSAYRVTGFTDFEEDFTGDYCSVGLCEFTIRYEEPNKEIDDMKHRVADGKSFSWDIQLVGKQTMNIGQIVLMEPKSYRNGEIVQSTAEKPISYLWETSDAEIATVDFFGNVKAVGAGTATVTVRLAQNPNVEKTVQIVVEESANGIAFLETIPEKLEMYEETTIKAAYYENGEAQQEELTWTFGGALKMAYTADVVGNSATIKCFGGSIRPLVITVSTQNGEYSKQIELALEGL